MTLEQALVGSPAPRAILESLELLSIPHFDFEGRVQIGQLVVARELSAEIALIFRAILESQFPIFQMTPVVAFNWNDDASMEANNSSAFNYRLKVGNSALSAHATGRAIDINPQQNPYIRGEIVLPPGAKYDPSAPGTLLENGPVVQAFESRGWVWGGRWSSLLDFHHFEKA